MSIDADVAVVRARSVHPLELAQPLPDALAIRGVFSGQNLCRDLGHLAGSAEAVALCAFIGQDFGQRLGGVMRRRGVSVALCVAPDLRLIAETLGLYRCDLHLVSSSKRGVAIPLFVGHHSAKPRGRQLGYLGLYLDRSAFRVRMSSAACHGCIRLGPLWAEDNSKAIARCA